MLLNPTALDPDTAASLLRDANGNFRAAMICWGTVLSASVILRIQRRVPLGCLAAGAATVVLVAAVVDMIPEPATASVTEPPIQVRGQIASPTEDTTKNRSGLGRRY
jgi:hypothetical protein